MCEQHPDDVATGISMRFSQPVARILDMTAHAVRAEGRAEVTCADVLITMHTYSAPLA